MVFNDLGLFINYLEQSTKVIFIANPNNPTGTYNSHDEVHTLLKKVPSSVLYEDSSQAKFMDKNLIYRIL